MVPRVVEGFASTAYSRPVRESRERRCRSARRGSTRVVAPGKSMHGYDERLSILSEESDGS
jgi:hypothetical protein